jgi:hypothetical protein
MTKGMPFTSYLWVRVADSKEKSEGPGEDSRGRSQRTSWKSAMKNGN